MLLNLTVENFKAIEAAQARFGRFTCLTGPPGSGKTALLQAVQFLGDLTRQSITEAAQTALGDEPAPLSNLFHGCDTDRVIRLKAEMLVDPWCSSRLGKTAAAVLAYDLRLRYADRLLRVDSETLTRPSRAELQDADTGSGLEDTALWKQILRQAPRDAKTLVSTDGGSVFVHVRGQPSYAAPADKTTLTVAGNHASTDDLIAARETMRALRPFALSAGTLRRDQAIGARFDEPGLGRSGEGAPAILKHIAETDPLALDRIVSHLHATDPHIEGIDVDAHLAICQEYFLVSDSRTPAALQAGAMSDTAIRHLGWLLMRYDQRWSGTLCVDRPPSAGMNPDDAARLCEVVAGCVTDPHRTLAQDNRTRQVIACGGSAEAAAADAVVELGTAGDGIRTP